MKILITNMNDVTVLILLFICHFLADYTPLSTQWMSSAKILGKRLFPIFCHALIHASLMIIAIASMTNIGIRVLSYLFVFQLMTHFLIDVWKGRMNWWFPALQSPNSEWYRIIFGLDQLLHTFVIIAMVRWLGMC